MEPSGTESRRTVKLTILTVLTHALLPLVVLPISLYVMPRFVASLTETGMEAPASLRLVLQVTGFVYSYWYLYILILVAGVIVDGAICFSLFGSQRRFSGDLWSGAVILVQALFAGLCILAVASVWRT